MITQIVKNLSCEAGKTTWTSGAKLTFIQNAMRLKAVRIYFLPGSGNQVYVKILKGGGALIPENSRVTIDPPTPNGDGIVGNDTEFIFPMETEIKRSETLEIQYRNTDAGNVHDIMVVFEVTELPTDQSQLRS